VESILQFKHRSSHRDVFGTLGVVPRFSKLYKGRSDQEAAGIPIAGVRATMKTYSIRKLIALCLVLAGASIGPSRAGSFDISAFTAADVNLSGGLDATEFNTTLEIGLSARAQAKLFRRADFDRDLAIQVNEFLIFRGVIQPNNRIERVFFQADLSINGTLDFNEFISTHPGRAPLVVIRRGFLRADTNLDSLVTLEEYVAFRRGQSPPGTLSIFQLADFDGNAQITLTEFGFWFPQTASDAKIQAKFARFDANADGVLTVGEWNPGVRG
jgi:Ca2+-binding EF-hand superfamily protein